MFSPPSTCLLVYHRCMEKSQVKGIESKGTVGIGCSFPAMMHGKIPSKGNWKITGAMGEFATGKTMHGKIPSKGNWKSE